MLLFSWLLLVVCEPKESSFKLEMENFELIDSREFLSFKFAAINLLFFEIESILLLELFLLKEPFKSSIGTLEIASFGSFSLFLLLSSVILNTNVELEEHCVLI